MASLSSSLALSLLLTTCNSFKRKRQRQTRVTSKKVSHGHLFLSTNFQSKRGAKRWPFLHREAILSSNETHPPTAADSFSDTGAIVVGGGLAGLAAATHLAAAGVPFVLLEASDCVGGRVQTDYVDGFVLDRGFQIFITAYPEARRLLNYESLDLQSFYAGALVWHGGGKFHRLADPFRHPVDAVGSLFNPIGTVLDKILVGALRLQAALRADEEIMSAPETTILKKLQSSGMSNSMVDGFFRPFFGGVFFDRELETTSRLFDFVFKCLALGSNTVPSNGIGEIPKQIAEKLPSGSVVLNSKVEEMIWEENEIIGARLADGRVIKSKYGAILAVEGPEAARLLGKKLVDVKPSQPPRSTVCLYFSADSAPPMIKDPILLLNGSGHGIVNNMFFPSTVAPSYSPPGKTLISISLIGYFEDETDAELENKVLVELSDWFGGSVVTTWKHLKTYRIKFAQPDQTPPTNLRKEPKLGPGVYVCGDHRFSATFDGALVSGRRAAEALLTDSEKARKP